jgi:hypothetical protein
MDIVESCAVAKEEVVTVLAVKTDVGADTFPPIEKAPWIARLVPVIAPVETDPVVIGPPTERPPPTVRGPDISTEP